MAVPVGVDLATGMKVKSCLVSVKDLEVKPLLQM